jgi:hypothetical protein
MRTDYGNKRDYPKINIYRHGVYLCSTTWAKNCREAREYWLVKNPLVDSKTIIARFCRK